MAHARVTEIIRHFPENGLKLLLHHPGNVRDLLALTHTELLSDLVVERMTVDPTSYVAADYRHLASDVVLRVPLRRRGGGPPGRGVIVSVLIELQSEPDPLMPLRVVEYQVQVWKAQVRALGGKLPPGGRLQPVLPVVLYTGLRPWPGLGTLTDLIALGERFQDVTPQARPLFVNLPVLSTSELDAAGGYFGAVLRLVQGRRAVGEEFRELLGRVVVRLEEMPPAQRLRWLELLSYIHALVYHERAQPERTELVELIATSVQTDAHRRELNAMTKTIAEALRDEGRKEGALQGVQQMLLVQLRERFRKVPRAMERVIAETQDIHRLEEWCKQLVRATSLEDVGIGPKPH
jgi:hypothetical protein